MTRPVVRVAAGILIDGAGRCLLARRPEGRAYAGYWEFPGGKVEPGESSVAALSRELQEELGIEPVSPMPWLQRHHDYPHARVQLDFFRVTQWRGELTPREGQTLVWSYPPALDLEPLLPANRPLLKQLMLPTVYGITHADTVGEAVMLERLESACQRGLRLIQVREKSWSPDRLSGFAQRVVDLATPWGARVLINGPVSVAKRVGAAGLHLNGAALGALTQPPDVEWWGASCPDREALERAARWGADFAVLGPVLPTPTHPGMAGLGWERAGFLLQGVPLPVYLIGGLDIASIPQAWQLGAQGVAMIRGLEGTSVFGGG